jgi:hypothetical protein
LGQYQFGDAGKDTFQTQRGIGFSFSVRKEWQLKERLKLQFRFDFQNPFEWYNWGNMTTTVDLKNVDASGDQTTSSLFGKVPSGNEATSVADGGVHSQRRRERQEDNAGTFFDCFGVSAWRSWRLGGRSFSFFTRLT